MAGQKTESVPNLFVIGVAKSGTTSLFQWLSDHPEIGASRDRETRHLMDADDDLCHSDGYADNGLQGYADLFEDRIGTGGIRYLIDVSPQYYYQETALGVIPFLASKKVIMVLRKPSSRLYSLFKYTSHNLSILPDDMDFPGFVEHLHLGRDSSLFQGKRMLEDALLHNQYAMYIRQWALQLEPQDFHICQFDDLKKDPLQFALRLSEFLGIDPEFYATYSFRAENKSVAIRNKKLHRLIRRFRARIPAPLRRRLKPLYMAANSTKSARSIPAGDQAALAALDAHFLDWEKDLSIVLKRNAPF
ncbi:sulfotransferase domain-containing protein [Candidatus Halocynthiibacter alkanivorans]|uniref:sulfotransferase domain-containing protein n=1 Tax=Candidatus Halocynthiibacter alkanivorans TaxID=2267619 RepID=UPI000DF26FAE|nr:sulfotransferase domain-containing protein [Candidatus Halocynthiibacter alkanivorans]